MPHHTPSFVGRVAELRELRNVLAIDRPEGTVAVVQSAFPGIGKSALAFEYAHVFSDNYPGGRWRVRAEGVSDMARAFIRLGRDLGMDITERDEADPDQAFRKVRAELQESGGCLLVFDNVDRPDLFQLTGDRALPDADRAHILATPRLERDLWPTNGTDFEFLPLGALSIEDGLRLLERYRGPDGGDERAAARAIAEALASHPFSLEVVGAFLALDANQATTYRSFYEHEIKAKGLTLSLDAAGGAVTLSRHDQSVITELLRHAFAQLHAEERLVLDYAALMDAEQVILPMLREFAGKDHSTLLEEGATGTADAWNKLIARLSALRLLTPTDAGEG
ncbi:hypothetical protein ACGTNG_04605 [Halomonas sp. 1390]|uniref:hypothetical protein n=1 Tax=Halomonas sp. B23F22_3 TaxID=3459516 RepID=UPI00373EA9DA